MSQPNDELVKAFITTLNQHGYAFQAAVTNEVKRLFSSKLSSLSAEVGEFPVTVQGQPTRIDLVLRHQSIPLVVVCECKRVNPAFSNWCFAHVPHPVRTAGSEYLITDHLRRLSGVGFQFESRIFNRAAPSYNLGIEVRSGEKGDPGGPSGRSAIEETAAQVLRGVNGLIGYYLKDERRLTNVAELSFAAMVVTTAALWVSEIDLTQTHLETGVFPQDRGNLRPASWLIFQYHLSPSIKYEHGYRPVAEDLRAALREDFVRSILVVSTAGLGNALSWLTDLAAA
jgi:hypothetical protein